VNINNPTTFSAPDLTYSTSNSSGTSGALRADDTLAIFSTQVPTTIAYSATAATGDNAFGSREDHVHGMFASAAAPVFGRVARSAGNITTTSTTLVDLTGATITFTTGAVPIAYGAMQTGESTGTILSFNIDIDGALEDGTVGVTDTFTANMSMLWSFSGQSVALSAAEHTVKEKWMVNSGTGTIYASSSRKHIFWAHEIR